MKRIKLTISSLILVFILSLLIPGSTASAKGKHVEHQAKPLTSACYSNPSNANCDGKWPDISGCWNDPLAYIVHSSGWYSSNGELMNIDLWYSLACNSAWTDTYDQSYGHNGYPTFRSGIENETDNYVWWSSTLKQEDIWSPMSYTYVEYAHGAAQDGVNHTYHNTPTYILS